MSLPVEQDLKQAREQVLIEHLDAERSGDAHAILATFARPRYELVGTGKVYEGVDEVGAYLRERHKAFPDLHTELIHLWHAEHLVVAELWLMGTLRGAFADVATTGRRFRCRTACFFEFEGSALTGVRAYFDTGTIARQLA